eukprot:TRINITY_DN69572_c0_g1_i1.p1 TRINITY_DN69572_c0_g1~~TRINITY_DN69572_c0_g1_i1.p1  ORF type:complete len:197 (-),score=13.19 TRINITY_DN69572_c0_g1_i1:108-698(-)
MEQWIVKAPRSDASRKRQRPNEQLTSHSFDHLRFSVHTAELATAAMREARHLRACLSTFFLLKKDSTVGKALLDHASVCQTLDVTERDVQHWAFLITTLLKLPLEERDKAPLLHHAQSCTDPSSLHSCVRECRSWPTQNGQVALNLVVQDLQAEVAAITRIFRASGADIRFSDAPPRPVERAVLADLKQARLLMRR